ncbi:MAG: hypothetical protein HY516_04420 [Candidatus Aenigmarchaeota archaeon]|nr:hypothetical protein [Candidatus Aenigmarchaeota archaeon]
MVWFVRKKLARDLTAENEQALSLYPGPEHATEPVENVPEVPVIREAPLFIKVDRYKEMLSYFGALKNNMETLRQLGSVLNSAQEMFKETNEALTATLEKTDKILEAMDAEMGRPQGLNIDIGIEAKRAEMKVSLNELKAQLEKLKGEVKAISA